jgi:mannose-6-phosphate isomerase-like protein (cupin superfamily)
MSEFVVIEDPKPQPQDTMLKDMLRRSAWLDDEVVKGAPYFDAAWVIKDIPKGPEVHLHHHDFDEYLGFMGNDGYNPMDLGCDVVIQVGGEILSYDKTFMVYIPAGVEHGIISMTNIKRPVLCYSGGPNVAYAMR